jgi:hypothetical protein
MDVYFSDHFKVDPDDIEKYGAFNVSLVADLPLFIDPFLLFNSKKTKYRELHNRIIEYLQFLRDKSVSNEGLSEGLLRAWYRFPEVKQNWLGFTLNSNRGSGLGRDFAVALHTNLHKLFADFGKEKVTHGSHLEKLCLVGDRVGRDNISDFTTNLILEYLLEYTQAFAVKHIAQTMRHVFTVDRVRFNRDTETWERGQFELPRYKGDFVLLTPRDLLTRDDTWINKTDLVDEFTSLPAAIPNQQLRDQIDNYFRKMLPKKANREQERVAAISTIRQFPELVDYYIRLKEERGDDAVSISSEKVRLSRQLYVQQFKELPELLSKWTAFYLSAGNTYDVHSIEFDTSRT